MDIKHIHCMLEDMAEYGKCMIETAVGDGNVNLDCAGKIVDMVKDLAEAEYHARLAKCLRKDEEEEQKSDEYILLMFKEQYGEDEGKRYYDDYRYKRSGRFAPRGKGSYMPRRGYEEPPYYHMMPEYMMSVDDYKNRTAEEMRDMDRATKNVMYYTEPIKSDETKREESKVERARRGYTETKMTEDNTPEGKKRSMESLDRYMKELADDMTQLVGNMDSSEKTMLKSKLQTLVQKIG